MLEKYREFEQCIVDAFTHLGFTPRLLMEQKDVGFDFVLTLNEVAQYAVEVKYYRSAHAKSSLIKTSAQRLLNAAKAHRISKAILVLSSAISPGLREELENDFQISIVDRTDLLMMTSNHSELNDKIRSLLETEASVEPRAPGEVAERIRASNRNTESVPKTELESKGRDLCQELKSIGKGKSNWREYEMKSAEALKYLFDEDLNGWHDQKRTDDGLNRYDLICRAKPLSEFWSFVINSTLSH